MAEWVPAAQRQIQTADIAVAPLVTADRQLARATSIYNAQAARRIQARLKRLLDILLTSLALLLATVPMLLIALAIKLESRGPVLFVQQRVGVNGRRFPMYKFRSMVIDAEARRDQVLHLNEMDGPMFKIKGDPRKTRVGRLLRRFSLDELPQLFNVLCGHMSLVGPRPFVPEEMERYTERQRCRLLAVPGMTGLWQVSGRSLLGFEQIVELDLRYVQDWSVWMDVRILLQTIPVVLSGKGAY